MNQFVNSSDQKRAVCAGLRSFSCALITCLFLATVLNSCGSEDPNAVVLVGGVRTYQPTAIGNFYIYPNPIFQSGVIHWEQNAAYHIRICLRSEDWRLVKVIKDADMSGGDYESTLTTKDVDAGVYFVVLESGDITLLQRVVVSG